MYIAMKFRWKITGSSFGESTGNEKFTSKNYASNIRSNLNIIYREESFQAEQKVTVTSKWLRNDY